MYIHADRMTDVGLDAAVKVTPVLMAGQRQIYYIGL